MNKIFAIALSALLCAGADAASMSLPQEKVYTELYLFDLEVRSHGTGPEEQLIAALLECSAFFEAFGKENPSSFLMELAKIYYVQSPFQEKFDPIANSFMMSHFYRNQQIQIFHVDPSGIDAFRSNVNFCIEVGRQAVEK